MKSARRAIDCRSKHLTPDTEEAYKQQIIHKKFLNFEYFSKPKRKSSKSPTLIRNFSLLNNDGIKTSSSRNKNNLRTEISNSPGKCETHRQTTKKSIDKSYTVSKVTQKELNNILLSGSKSSTLNSIKNIDMDKLIIFKEQTKELKNFNNLKSGLRLNFERTRGKSVPK